MGVLINGKYYKNPSEAPQEARAAIGTQVDSWSRSNTAQRFDMELIQPYLPDGTPNPDFVKYYPKEAKEYGMEV